MYVRDELKEIEMENVDTTERREPVYLTELVLDDSDRACKTLDLDSLVSIAKIRKLLFG